jgi:hypothetical protein
VFRPTFETLEKREVFSAGPIDVPAPPVSDIASPTGLVATTYGRGLVGDFNGDGRDDVAGIAGDGIRALRQLLPYMEQDNVYQSSGGSAIDVVFDRDMTQSQIIAVLIGLVRNQPQPQFSLNFTKIEFANVGRPEAETVNLTTDLVIDVWEHALTRSGVPSQIADVTDGTSNTILFSEAASRFSNTVFDDEAFVSPVHLDLLGWQAAADHDAVFEALGTKDRAVIWMDIPPPQSLMALLVP